MGPGEKAHHQPTGSSHSQDDREWHRPDTAIARKHQQEGQGYQYQGCCLDSDPDRPKPVLDQQIEVGVCTAHSLFVG